MWITLAVASGIFVILALMGAASAHWRKRQAPRCLEEAGAALERGEVGFALECLDDAFIVPLTSRYRRADAEHAYHAVCLLERTLEAMAAEPEDFMGPVKEAYWLASKEGGLVPRGISEPIKKFLLRNKHNPILVDDYLESLRHELLDVPDVVDELADLFADLPAEQRRVIAAIDNTLGSGRGHATLEAVNTRLGEARAPAYEVALRYLRAGALTMMGDREGAVDDYLHCATLQPGRAQHALRVALTYESLARVDEANSWATRAVRIGNHRDAVRRARALRRRLEHSQRRRRLLKG